MMNVVDLFAGCGGLSKGFEQASFKILLGIDNDKDSGETFLNNHNGAEYFLADIREIKKTDLQKKLKGKKVDVLIGGPPCQGFSLSGKRVFLDSRNALYIDYFRILDLLKPSVALIENVPGLKSLYGGKALERIESEFERRGYIVAHKILQADDYGVPQIRRRIFIVGTKGEKFLFPEKKKFKISLGEAISDLPKLISGEEKNTYKSKPKNKYQKLMRKNCKTLTNHKGTNHTEKTIKIINMVPEGRNYKSLPKKLHNTRKVNIAWTRLDSSKPSLTIDTGHRHHFHPWENRVPSVRESARIQSFPDDFIFSGSKTSQYKQVGNAVPPILAKAMAEQIKKWFKDVNKV